MENKPTVFLFPDTQVVEEAFLKDINNILSSGEVPNLYKSDEFEVCVYDTFMHALCLCLCVGGGQCGCMCVGNEWCVCDNLFNSLSPSYGMHR